MMFSAVTKAALFFIAVNSVAAAPTYTPPNTQPVIHSSVNTSSQSGAGSAASSSAFQNSSTDWNSASTSGGSTTNAVGPGALAFASNNGQAIGNNGNAQNAGMSGSDTRWGQTFTQTGSTATANGANSSAGQNSVANANGPGGFSSGGAGAVASTDGAGNFHAGTGTTSNTNGPNAISISDADAHTENKIWKEHGQTDVASSSKASGWGANAGSVCDGKGNVDPWGNVVCNTATSNNGVATGSGNTNIWLDNNTDAIKNFARPAGSWKRAEREARRARARA